MKDRRLMARWRARASMALMMGMMSSMPVDAREFVDSVMTPWLDPLLSMPPELQALGVLPGDAAALDCATDVSVQMAASVTGKVLHLSDVVHLALCQSPQIQAAWASVQIQAAQVGTARAAYLPRLTAGVSRVNQKTAFAESQAQFNTDTTRVSSYVALTWRLLDFGARAAQHSAAQALFDAALASHDAVLQKALAQVIDAYYGAQISSAARRAKSIGETLARQTLATALKREARGIGARADTLQAQTALARAELDSSRAIGADARARSALMVAMGVSLAAPAAQDFLLADDERDIPDHLYQDLAGWLTAAHTQHPALLAAQAQLASSREQLKAARAEGLPVLDLSMGRYFNGRPDQAGAAASRETAIGLALAIPLFDGFTNTYKVRAAQARIALKEAEVRETESQIGRDVVNAHAEAMAALRNLHASGKLVEAASQALHDVRSRYDLGLVDILAMLNVQAALADAEQERIRSLSEWASARLRLAAHAGVAGLKALQRAP